MKITIKYSIEDSSQPNVDYPQKGGERERERRILVYNLYIFYCFLLRRKRKLRSHIGKKKTWWYHLKKISDLTFASTLSLIYCFYIVTICVEVRTSRCGYFHIIKFRITWSCAWFHKNFVLTNVGRTSCFDVSPFSLFLYSQWCIPWGCNVCFVWTFIWWSYAEEGHWDGTGILLLIYPLFLWYFRYCLYLRDMCLIFLTFHRFKKHALSIFIPFATVS